MPNIYNIPDFMDILQNDEKKNDELRRLQKQLKQLERKQEQLKQEQLNNNNKFLCAIHDKFINMAPPKTYDVLEFDENTKELIPLNKVDIDDAYIDKYKIKVVDTNRRDAIINKNINALISQVKGLIDMYNPLQQNTYSILQLCDEIIKKKTYTYEAFNFIRHLAHLSHFGTNIQQISPDDKFYNCLKKINNTDNNIIYYNKIKDIMEKDTQTKNSK